MPATLTPADLSPAITELLACHCDLTLGGESSGSAMLQGSPTLAHLGGDAAGGCFYAWGDGPVGARPIVYLSAYGETARFAANFHEALAVLVDHPQTWLDALVAAHKSEALTRTVLAGSEASLDHDELVGRDELRAALGLTEVDAAAVLRTAVLHEPPFAPVLTTASGPMAAVSFALRPFPR